MQECERATGRAAPKRKGAVCKRDSSRRERSVMFIVVKYLKYKILV